MADEDRTGVGGTGCGGSRTVAGLTGPEGPRAVRSPPNPQREQAEPAVRWARGRSHPDRHGRTRDDGGRCAPWSGANSRGGRRALLVRARAVEGMLSCTALTGAVVAGLGGIGVVPGLALAAQPVGPVAGRGLAVLGLGPAAIALAITVKALADEEGLPAPERAARRDGRVAASIGAGAAVVGGLAWLRTAGTVRGLRAAGVTAGLERIGDGSTIAGATRLLTTPALAARVTGYGIYRLSRRLRGEQRSGYAPVAGAPENSGDPPAAP